MLKNRKNIWSLLNNSGLDGCGLSVYWNSVVVFLWSPGVFHSQDFFPSTFRSQLWETSSGVVAVGVCTAEARRELWARLPRRPLLKMCPTVRDETSRGRNPENGRCRDFVRRQRHSQSGFQHTDRPWPSSPELFNKDHNTGRDSLSHLKEHRSR